MDLIVETQADRLRMLAVWGDTFAIGSGDPVACVYDEPFGEEAGMVGRSPQIETDLQAWIDAGGAVGVTVTIVSGRRGALGDMVAREQRVLEDGGMMRVRLESSP